MCIRSSRESVRYLLLLGAAAADEEAEDEAAALAMAEVAGGT